MKIIKLIRSLGMLGVTKLVLDLVLTRFVLSGARIIRWPFYLQREGQVTLGKGFSCGPGLIMDVFGKDAELNIGSDFKAYHNLHLGVVEKITIGDRVLVASGVYISDHSHGAYNGPEQSSPLVPPNDRPLISSPISIGDDCWLGERVCILPGVTIGKGVIIGAGAVVTTSLPDYVIAVGMPARAIKKFDFDTNTWVPIQPKG